MRGPAGVEAPKPGRLSAVTRRVRASRGTIGSNTVRSVRRECRSRRSGPRPVWTRSKSKRAAVTGRGRLAVPAGRELPRVHRLLEELLGVVGPELADGRIGVDDRVLEHAADLLDLADIDVLGRVAVLVDLDRPARRVLDLHPAQGGHEGGPVFHATPDRLHRLLDDPRAGVAVLRVEGRRARVGLREGG